MRVAGSHLLSLSRRQGQYRVALLIMDRVPPAASGVRAASTYLYDKAYVNGQWVAANGGASFEGNTHLFILQSDLIFFQ